MSGCIRIPETSTSALIREPETTPVVDARPQLRQPGAEVTSARSLASNCWVEQNAGISLISTAWPQLTLIAPNKDANAGSGLWAFCQPATHRMGNPRRQIDMERAGRLRRCFDHGLYKLRLMRPFLHPFALACVLAASVVAPAYTAEEPDLIFRRSTVFKWLTPNDKLATYGLDDPEVDGVACHFTVPERGGFKGWIGVAEEVSDISLSCSQVGPIVFKEKFEQGEDVFRKRRSLFFKKMQIVRGCDEKRNVLVYMVYSDRIIEGSPKNSTSSVPIMPWGNSAVARCLDWIQK